jgi:2-keto-4-pentenoate hydratase/2-oxohepta-3-ene-1,7-dioic acid hydratase in catechol pathway
MRFLRLIHEGAEHWARVVDDASARLWTGAPYLGGVETERVVPMEGAVCPVLPSKIVCVGRNYAAHAKELGNEVPKEPLLFLKPPSSLIGPGAAIELPPESARVEFEGELCIVIGKSLRRASVEDALAGIFGVTVANDVTARDLQKKDVQFTRGKGFDTFCPVGPWIETAPLDLANLTLTTRVNGEIKQHGLTSNMVFNVGVLLAYISQSMTLVPGDIVLTGTPEGVGPLVSGDVVEVEVSGVGVLRNVVR